MRPTDLKFRSPKQKTPEYYNSKVTVDGRILNFIASSQNKKRTFTSQERFPQYQDWAKITGQFLGPGSYNQNENYQKLKAIPCSAIYRNQSMGKETGRPAFIMIGNNLQYEPKFENISTQKSKDRIGIDELGKVSSISAFGRTRMRSLRKSNTRGTISNSDNINNINTTLNHMSFLNKKSMDSSHIYDNSLIQSQYMNRPQSSYQAIRPMSQLMNTEQRVQSAATNQMIYEDAEKEDDTQCPGTNQKSVSTKASDQNGYANSMQDSQVYQNNLEDSQLQLHQMYSNRLQQLNGAQLLKNGNKVFYAKTAQNFYNLAKGLWRPKSKSGKNRRVNMLGPSPYAQNLQKSINVLQAYGEYDNFRNFSRTANSQGGRRLAKSSGVRSLNQSAIQVRQGEELIQME
eukprot:403365740